MKRKIRRIIDIAMSLVLFFLMAYQVTGEKYHEYLGVSMTVLVIVHIFLNRYWYPALFKGRYNIYRIIVTFTDLSLMLCFFMTALCGVSMSAYALPFLYGVFPVSFARSFHLCLSHWTFVLMSFHLGLHIPAILSQFKLRYSTKRDLRILFIAMGAYGFSAFLKAGFLEYMFMKKAFAFYDPDKGALRVLLDLLLISSFFMLAGEECASLTLMLPGRKDRKKNILYPVLCIVVAIIIGISLAAMME